MTWSTVWIGSGTSRCMESGRPSQELRSEHSCEPSALAGVGRSSQRDRWWWPLRFLAVHGQPSSLGWLVPVPSGSGCCEALKRVKREGFRASASCAGRDHARS
jgi:hypothetical protein